MKTKILIIILSALAMLGSASLAHADEDSAYDENPAMADAEPGQMSSSSSTLGLIIGAFVLGGWITQRAYEKEQEKR